MLAAILFILKIIGLILLVVVGLVLLMVFLVLLVPIRYRADAEYYGKPKAAAKVTWLLHMLSVKVQYETEPDVCIRVFGFRVKPPEPPESGQDTPEEKYSRPVSTAEPEMEKPPAPEKNAEVQKDISGQLQEEERCVSSGRKKKQTAKQKTEESVRECLFEKLKAAKQKKDEIMEILHNEEYRKTFRLVSRQIFGIVKHVLPEDIQGKVRFGFEDPFKTGQILTYISPFYALYAKHLELTPVFEEQVMEGELWLKGRIRIGTILAKAVRLLFDKNIRKLIRKFRKG